MLCVLAISSPAIAQTALPSGKSIDSSVERGLPVNSFPAAIAVSPDRKYAVILNNGYGTLTSKSSQSLAVLDLAQGTVSDFPDARLGRRARQTYFYGLAFSSDGKKVYASLGSETDPEGKSEGSTGNGIAIYTFDQGKLSPSDLIPVPPVPLGAGHLAAAISKAQRPNELISYPAGLAVIKQGGKERLVVAGNLSDRVFLIDVETKKIVRDFDVSTHSVIPAAYPLSVLATQDGSRAYVSLWNASRIAELDLKSGKVLRMIPVGLPADPTETGSHPCAMVFDDKEKNLYVALANRDEVAVIERKSGSVRRTVPTTPPNIAFRGAFPIALAITKKQLFVANSAMNSIAVVELDGLRKKQNDVRPSSFIPTEWYPSALARNGDDELVIANAKGRGTGSNGAFLPKDDPSRRKHPYILSLLAGSITRVNLEGAMRRAATPKNANVADASAVRFQGGANPIKHVIYVVKENRTYDQVFGDISAGNGDPSLLLYGEEITPNQHKLAKQFGILDNFYVSGEVSGDGHNWTMSATGSDYLEKTIQVSYRGKERTYDYEGEVANRFPLEDGMPDINEPSSGYIFSLVAKHGLRYRHYGEFVTTRWCEETRWDGSPTEGTPGPTKKGCDRSSVKQGEALPAHLGTPRGGASPWPWSIPMISENVPTKPELREHFDPLYADFEMAFPDQLRADEFLNEFAKFVVARKSGQGEELPNYILLRLPNDHTSGTKAGAATPSAAVADNDLALGRVVEAVSHSPYWDDTAILVLEDDAQDGADHVDAHRSPALIISKYSPGNLQQPYVESTFYTTVSMVRTLEVLLGLPPMNLNDAYAPVIGNLFSGPGTQEPFMADYRNQQNGLLFQVNKPNAPGGKESAAMDFSRADAADAELLNRILWQDRRPNEPMPPIHSHFGSTESEE